MPQVLKNFGSDLSRLLQSPWFSLIGYQAIALGGYIQSYFSQVDDNMILSIRDWLIFYGGALATAGVTYKAWTSDVAKQLTTVETR